MTMSKPRAFLLPAPHIYIYFARYSFLSIWNEVYT